MLTRMLRKIILKEKLPFQFEKYQDNIDFDTIPNEIGLYVHIPFCKSLCPFCPYTKVLYNAEVAKEYKCALLEELMMLGEHLAGRHITSIYFGGGTPTLMIDEITEILQWIKQELGSVRNIGIELHPGEARPEILKKLKTTGINMVSVGVQTFQDTILRDLGRTHSGAEARSALTQVIKAGFDCVDADIMFNLPNQTGEDLKQDIVACYELGVDQLSTYPLILFPMTSLTREAKQRGFRFSTDLREYRLLKLIEDISSQYGFMRTSVWTYAKPSITKYTSVTRESFIGLGAGATSQFGQYFYLNTFDAKAYIERVRQDILPINLVNHMSRREKMVYWLFWRCYETAIDLHRFEEIFGTDMQVEFSSIIRLAGMAGLVNNKGGVLKLSPRGTYFYHLLEKQYSKTYLNDTWAACQVNPWLDRFILD